MGGLGQLRYEPIDKRIRGMLADKVLVDTQRAVLVWEPKRVVPSYAVPGEEVEGFAKASAEASSEGALLRDGEATGIAPRLGDRPVYDPSIPFSVHTTDGEALDIRVGDHERQGAGFRLRDDALEGYVMLDFDAFDAWYEEDELNVSHPRDPFHRIEIVHSRRRVRVEREGQLLAETAEPYLLFESLLPVRYYLLARRGGRDPSTERDPDSVRIQGPGGLFIASERGGHRLELSRTLARSRRSSRSGGFLQRARRPCG
jgi:uncharacterized protein (DUF427 family)